MATIDEKDCARFLKMAANIINNQSHTFVQLISKIQKIEKLEKENRKLRQENTELKNHLTPVPQNNWNTK
jgi:cell shape-determining protein MreC